MKEYNIRVSRSVAVFFLGKEGKIIHDRNKPVILLNSNYETRKLKVRNLNLWERLCLFINSDYKSYKSI